VFQESPTLSKVVTNSESAFGIVAMKEEIESFHKNQIWDLVKLPEGTKTVVLRRSLYGLEQSLDSGTSVLCIVGNFLMVLLFICCSMWMTCLFLLNACLRLRD
jgi:hypothetical protein